jgi:hypothetical protein
VGFMAGCSCPVDGLGMGNLDGTKDDVWHEKGWQRY